MRYLGHVLRDILEHEHDMLNNIPAKIGDRVIAIVGQEAVVYGKVDKKCEGNYLIKIICYVGNLAPHTENIKEVWVTRQEIYSKE